MLTSTTKHKKDKSKRHKKASAEAAPDSGKNEGVDLNWAYKPPPGAKVITTDKDNGEFDWDSVKDNDDVEVWVIRVPNNIQPKHLEGLSLDLDTDLVNKGRRKTACIGGLQRKHISYDIWSLGDEDTDVKTTETISSPVVGGEDLRYLSCLLPRESKMGELYVAPKPISRRLIVTAHPPQPSSTSKDPSTASTVHQNPPREKYPPDLLTHRFMPYGSLVDPHFVRPSSPNENMMEVDSIVAEVDEKEVKKSKKKKEKAERVKERVEVEVVVDAEPKVERGKRTSNKRKSGDHPEASRPAKKSKMAKTASR